MSKKYLDHDGLNYLWGKLKTLLAGKADANHTHSAYVNKNAFGNVKVGTTTIAAETTTDTLTIAAGDNVTLTPDATNDKLTIAAKDTTYSEATTSAAGLMSASDKSKLNGIATGANNYSHPTTSGNKHIPSGGSSGQILRWSADGTAAWGADNNTTYSNMGAATASTAGTSGLVPAPAAGKHTSFLRGDGTWVVPTNTTYSNMTGATSSAAGKAGLVPAPASGKQASYLRGDGTWAVPTNTTYNAATTTTAGLMSASDKSKLDGIASGANAYSHPSSHPASMITGLATVATSGSYNDLSNKPTIPAAYTHPTTSGNKHIPSGGSSGQPLRWSADGTAVWGADNNTTYSAATQSAAGLMSAADKTKLDGITTITNTEIDGISIS